MNTITRHTVLLLAVLVALAALTACGSDREDERVVRIGIAVSETGRFEAEGEHTRRAISSGRTGSMRNTAASRSGGNDTGRS